MHSGLCCCPDGFLTREGRGTPLSSVYLEHILLHTPVKVLLQHAHLPFPNHLFPSSGESLTPLCFKRSRIERSIKSLLSLSAPVSWRNLHLLPSKNIPWYPAFYYYVWTAFVGMFLFLLVISFSFYSVKASLWLQARLVESEACTLYSNKMEILTLAPPPPTA